MDEKLKRILEELESELGEEPGGEEAGYHRLGELLPRYTESEPTARQTSALIERLMPLLNGPDADPAPTRPRFAEVMEAEQAKERASGVRRDSLADRLLQVVQPQLLLLSVWFWIGSIAIVIVSLALMLGQEQPLGALRSSNPLVLLAPLLSLLGIAYSCRSYGTPTYELELSFPITPAQWLTAKIAAIFVGYVVLFAAAGCVLYWNDGVPLLAFTISWLVPLALYGSLTLALLLKFGPFNAAGAMLLFWTAQLAGGTKLGAFYFLADASYEHWQASKLAGGIAALLAAAYVVLRLRKEKARSRPVAEVRL